MNTKKKIEVAIRDWSFSMKNLLTQNVRKR